MLSSHGKVLIACGSLLLAACVTAQGIRSTVDHPSGAQFTLIEQTPFPVPATLKDHRIYVTFDQSPRLTAFFKTRLANKGYRIVDSHDQATYVIKFIGGAHLRGFVPGFFANYRIYQQKLAYLAESGEPICAGECGKWKAFYQEATVYVAGGVIGVDPDRDSNKLGLSAIGVAKDTPSLMMDDLVRVVLDRIVARLDGAT